MKQELLLLSLIFAFMAISCTRLTDLDQLKNMNCFQKKDYSHQVEEDFRLDIRGYSKTINLNLKYLDKYTLDITNGDIGFPGSYKFNGKLQLQFFYKDRLVRELEVVRQGVAWDMTNKKGDIYKEISLAYFQIPLDNKYKDNLSLKVTVIKPDTNIGEFGKELKIVIGVMDSE